MEESLRRELESKQMAADEALRQKEDLRHLQHQIKAEEDSLRERQRREARARSEAVHAARQREAEERSAGKHAIVQRNLAEMEETRKLRAEVGIWMGKGHRGSSLGALVTKSLINLVSYKLQPRVKG